MDPYPLEERTFPWRDELREIAVSGGKEGEKDKCQKGAKQLKPETESKKSWPGQRASRRRCHAEISHRVRSQADPVARNPRDLRFARC